MNIEWKVGDTVDITGCRYFVEMRVSYGKHYPHTEYMKRYEMRNEIIKKLKNMDFLKICSDIELVITEVAGE